MKLGDQHLIVMAIITLINILLFLIWEHIFFIAIFTFCFSVIGFITIRKEVKPIPKVIEK